MNFDYTFSAVLEGYQTQTTRRIPSGYHFDPVRRVLLSEKGQPVTFVGKLEAIAVKIGHRNVEIGTIRLLNIRQMKLRHITEEDAWLEGCRDLNDFSALWLLANGRFDHDDMVLVYNFKLSEVFHEQLALIR